MSIATETPRKVTAQDFHVDRYGDSLKVEVRMVSKYGHWVEGWLVLSPQGGRERITREATEKYGDPTKGAAAATGLPGYNGQHHTWVNPDPIAYVGHTNGALTNDPAHVKQARRDALMALPVLEAGDEVTLLGVTLRIVPNDGPMSGDTPLTVEVEQD